MFYTNYKGRSIGRILGSLEIYCGLQVAEMAQVGDGSVTYRGQPFATFTWIGDTDVPQITFLESAAPTFYEENSRKRLLWTYNRNQRIFQPFLDDNIGRMYATYVVKELSKLDESPDDQKLISIISEWTNRFWKGEYVVKHLDHFKTQAAIDRGIRMQEEKIRLQEEKDFNSGNFRRVD